MEAQEIHLEGSESMYKYLRKSMDFEENRLEIGENEVEYLADAPGECLGTWPLQARAGAK